MFKNNVYKSNSIMITVRILIVTFLILCFTNANAQEINNPNFGIKSHPTLEILKIEQVELYTKVSLQVKNEIANGWFCADKKIYIKNTNGTDIYYLHKSENIPVCPDIHQFTMVGEILEFHLYFYRIAPNLKFVDLVEDCRDACFYFKGVVIDQKINNEINIAFDLYATGKTELAIIGFQKLITDNPTYKYGNWYYYIVKFCSETGRISDARNWYNKLLQSGAIDKNDIANKIRHEKLVK